MFGMLPQRRENEVRTDTPYMSDAASMKLFRDLARALPLPTQWPRTTAEQRHDDLRDWHRARRIEHTGPLRLIALVDGALDDTMLVRNPIVVAVPLLVGAWRVHAVTAGYGPYR
ncbi:hypothetical protein [Burkholderia sp. PR2]|uniref:hypothetical protein n=1 Tax=Burkholderia sp. PR2 TaxID=3448078 RepID=UPI00402A9390